MVIGIGAAAFWIALAAVLITGGYFNFRRERLRQETLLRLVEKTGQLDEQQIRALYPPPPPLPAHVWGPPEYPDGRRILKVFGTVALSFAAGLAIFFLILFNMGTPGMQLNAIWGFAWSALIACFGVGLFVAARFVRPPIKSQHVERETA
jgi:hypothetical protein